MNVLVLMFNNKLKKSQLLSIFIFPVSAAAATRSVDDDDYSLWSNECPCWHDKDYTD